MRENEIREAFEEIEKLPDYVMWDKNAKTYKEILFKGKKGVDLDWWMRSFGLFKSGFKSRDKEITTLTEALAGAYLMNEKLKKELELYKGMVV